jgi:predicted Ser/Thr protein kinase
VTSDQWRRARDLFEQALDQPVGRAESWLDAQRDDPELVAEVRSLLNHHTRAGAFLDGTVTDRLPELLVDGPRFEAGTSIGAYVVKREIGRGGMGRVYLATDTRLGRDVALKVLPPHLVQQPSQRERLRREARAAAALNHPNICTVYALEEIDDDVVIAAEYVDGRTLRDEIEAGPSRSSGEILQTARDLAEALAAAHARGITHRDLKPENVMRAADGRLKVLDFGLALTSSSDGHLGEPRVTTAGTLVGTPAYMAPEQLNGGVVDARTDLFAYGVLVYEYATGVHPFAAASPLATIARILESTPQPIASIRPVVPPSVAAVVDRCLQKSPGARFASAADLLSALSAPLPADDQRARSPRWWRTHMLVIIALYLVAAVVGWLVKEWDHGYAEAGFVVLGMLAAVGGVLRGHLLFAERNHSRRTFEGELERRAATLTLVDMIIGVALVVEGALVAQHRPVAGVLVIGLGVSMALARLVVEKTTTESAFGRDGAFEP